MIGYSKISGPFDCSSANSKPTNPPFVLNTIETGQTARQIDQIAAETFQDNAKTAPPQRKRLKDTLEGVPFPNHFRNSTPENKTSLSIEEDIRAVFFKFPIRETTRHKIERIRFEQLSLLEKSFQEAKQQNINLTTISYFYLIPNVKKLTSDNARRLQLLSDFYDKAVIDQVQPDAGIYELFIIAFEDIERPDLANLCRDHHRLQYRWKQSLQVQEAIEISFERGDYYSLSSLFQSAVRDGLMLTNLSYFKLIRAAASLICDSQAHHPLVFQKFGGTKTDLLLNIYNKAIFDQIQPGSGIYEFFASGFLTTNRPELAQRCYHEQICHYFDLICGGVRIPLFLVENILMLMKSNNIQPTAETLQVVACIKQKYYAALYPEKSITDVANQHLFSGTG